MAKTFRTIVDIPLPDFRITHHTKIMLIGSCFTENIGSRLAEYKFPVDINPAGIQYNPLSVTAVLKRAMEGREFRQEELEHAGGRWFSYLHHGGFSAGDPASCLQRINDRLRHASDFLRSADLLCITFGTAWYYLLKRTGAAVSNCHKQPSELFERRFLEPEAVFDTCRELAGRLAGFNPKLRLLFTVSPVRHLRDGAHGNQVSKASLLAGVDRFCRDRDATSGRPGGCYFPAYEIMMDELRDYRFYNEDMVHPGPAASAYMYERFEETWMDEETRSICREIDPLTKALGHRVMDEQHDEYRTFRGKTLARIEELEKKYPFLSFENERRRLSLQPAALSSPSMRPAQRRDVPRGDSPAF